MRGEAGGGGGYTGNDVVAGNRGASCDRGALRQFLEGVGERERRTGATDGQYCGRWARRPIIEVSSE